MFFKSVFVAGVLLVLGCSDQNTQSFKPDAGLDVSQDIDTIDAQALSVEPDQAFDVLDDTDGPQPVPDYWDYVVNRCADVAADLPSQPQGAVQPPPANLTATLAWQRSDLCPNEFPGVFDLDSTIGTLAMGESQGKTVVFEAFESTFAPLAGYGLKGIARLDPATGLSQGCLLPPSESGVFGPPMHVDPRMGDSPLVVSLTYQDDSTYETNPVLRWWSPSWQTDETLPVPPNVSVKTPESFLLSDGQLLIFISPERIASVDSGSGQLNWVMRPSDLQVALGKEYPIVGPLSRLFTSFDPATRQIHIQVISAEWNSINEGVNVTISHCGDVKKTNEPIQTRLAFGNGFLEISPLGYKYKLRTLDAAGDVKLSVPSCDSVISLESDRVACLTTQHKTLSLAVIQWPDIITNITLDDSSRPHGGFVEYSPAAIALRDRLIVVQATYGTPLLQNSYQRFSFVDWATGAVMTHVDIPMPEVGGGWSPVREPVVDDQGNLVISMYGSTFGVATNTSGLSPTLFPRGFYLGRNGNLGVAP